MSEATKFDIDKPRMDLVPPEAVYDLATVLSFGANKYAERNWEKGMSWGRVFAAAQRHLWSFWGGENRDPESGLLHLAHALCCISFLTTYWYRGVGTDDRPGKEQD
jgi:hypothetical protein